jgi:hypothetical protein
MAKDSFSYSTAHLDKRQIGFAIEEMVSTAKNKRYSFERRWYDNNFFDDGYHFRYLSRTENKIVDLSRASTVWAPMRSIPKASRQIRGVSNLLASRNYIPIIYPEKIGPQQFPPIQGVDPQTGQPIRQQNPEYKKAVEEAKRIAQSTGHWIEEEFKEQDLTLKMALMIILAAKHGVSYLQVWPSAIDETLKTMVLDAFDVYNIGSVNEMEDSPFHIKAKSRLISEIKADERFDMEQVLKISPDNRYASSDIKEAYAKARYGGMGNADQAATVIEKEAFIKEYLGDDNEGRIKQQEDGGELLKRRKKGDPVYRHTFEVGNITLLDEYLNIRGYPLVDFRFEPGPLHQVPLIERFIPANKSFDLVVSRIERYLHLMVTGSWSVKAGEPHEPNNMAGGQIFNYNTTPPVQNPIANVPPFVFNFMGLLESIIEEQGVTTTALGKIPSGVKAHAAIESLKESEFANLAIASERLKGMVKTVAEKMLDYADDYFVKPQTVYYLEKGEPQYFDIIGKSALKKRQDLKLDEENPIDAVPISRDYRVDINVESGIAYTREGQKQAAKELGDYLVQLSQLGLVGPEVVKVYFQQMLEIYQFGSNKEIMEAMDQYIDQGGLNENDIERVKVALIEVFKDLINKGVIPDEDQRVQEVMLALAQVIKDTGLMDNVANRDDPKVQMDLAKGEQEIQHKDESHKQDMINKERSQQVKEETARKMTEIKEKMLSKAKGDDNG